MTAFQKQSRHFANLLQERLGFSTADGRDVDLEQAHIRVIIGAGLLLYAGYVVTNNDITARLLITMIASTIPLAAGLWMTFWFNAHSRRPAAMRYFAICADIFPLTIGLWGADESGIPLLGIYLWVTVGNGFRFGPRYLLFAYWLSCACFLALLVFVPFWQIHRAIGVGFALILATIPLYVLVLLSRLTAQKDAALELSNAKSRFVANVSHELRTPLTGVFAVYELLRRRNLGVDERALTESLGKAITTLKDSVDAILQMSKLEAGAERAHSRPFILRHFLNQVASLFEPQASAKGLTWVLDMDGDVPGTVYGDPVHLQHVLGNLLNNALKFTSLGTIRLHVGKIGKDVRFEVIDTGIGIPLQKQESLFERFVQADTSATRKYGGTGLGTSIAHDLVKLMGGTIGVSSTLGAGSTFWFQLPLDANWALTQFCDSERETQSDFRNLAIVGEDWERWQLSPKIRAMGLIAHDCTLGLPEGLEDYLAVLIEQPLKEARMELSFSEILRSASAICPTIVVCHDPSPANAAALFDQGATEVISADVNASELERVLVAAAWRIPLRVSPKAEANYHGATNRRLRVLLADDNLSNQLLLRRMLEDAGYEVECASRGDAAYDIMIEGSVDLALLDLNMPEMSGPDIVKLFRVGEVGSDLRLPVIIMSADATASSRDESILAGADAYLTKPVTVADLVAAIEKVTPAELRNLTAVVRPRSAEGGCRVAFSESARLHGNDESAARRAPSSLLDSERIEALKKIAREDNAFLVRYCEAAFFDLEAAINELQGALKCADCSMARDALHKIEGTAASIGALALLRVCRRIHHSVSARHSIDAAGVAELVSMFVLSKSALTVTLYEARSADRPTA